MREGVERRAVAGWLTWGGGAPSGSMRRNVCRVGGLAWGPGGLPECDASTVDDCRNERAPCFRERDQILTFEIRLYGPTYVVALGGGEGRGP